MIRTSYSWIWIIHRSSITSKNLILLVPRVTNCNCFSNFLESATSIRKLSIRISINILITSNSYIPYRIWRIHDIKRRLEIIMLTKRLIYHRYSIIIEVYIIDHPSTWTILFISWFNDCLSFCKFRVIIPCVVSTVSIFIDRCKVINVLQCPRRASCCISSKLCSSSYSLTITWVTSTWIQTCCSVFNRVKHSLHKFVHIFNFVQRNCCIFKNNLS